VAVLRAVGKDEVAEPRVLKSVTQAAAGGSQLELLVAMRARVADAVEQPNTPARDLAALTRRLHELAKDIAALQAKELEEADGASSAGDEVWDAEAI
jgi:predicted phage-related endonuclease